MSRSSPAALASLAALLMAQAAGPARAESDPFGLGTGRSGALSLTETGTINTYTPIVQAVSAGAASVTVDSSALRGAPGAFAAGELVLLWHPVGWAGPASSATCASGC